MFGYVGSSWGFNININRVLPMLAKQFEFSMRLLLPGYSRDRNIDFGTQPD